MCGAFAHGAIFLIRDYDPEANKGNVLHVFLITRSNYFSLKLGFSIPGFTH
jgi:photosystem I P700 chlorophyll a apoprotein A2